MHGFELKPEQLGYYRRNAGPIVWSHPRDSVPPLLVDRVSLTQWQQTFDAVKSCIDLEQQTAAEMMGQMENPFIMCCGMGTGKMMAAEEKIHQQWTDMLRTEQAKYLPLGIQVSFAKELAPVGAGSHRHLSNQTVGLKFELVQGGGGVPATSGGGGDIVERLEKLSSLYKQGAITSEEYDKAKAKILGS